MWIRMISTAAGPRLPHPLLSEKVYEVDDELGEELIKVRAAEKADDPALAQAKKEAPAEVAAVDDGEKAVDPGAEKQAESLMGRLTKPAEASKAPEAEPAKAGK